MNSLERVRAVLAGQVPDRVPVCLHNFLLAAKEAGVPLQKSLEDPDAAARIHLHAVEKYRHDCILIDLDTTMLAEAMGAPRDCAPNEPGHMAGPAIRSLDEVDKLKPADPERDGRIPVLLEAVRILRRKVGNEIAIRGNADQGPFSLAALMRGIQEFFMDLASNPDHPGISKLLEVCYQTHIATHRALKKAGAHFTSLGESTGGPDMISPKMYRQYARRNQERLVRELAADDIFSVIHICGDTSLILNDLAEYPDCGFELDYKTDAARAKQTAGRQHVLFGNIDPSGVIARGTVAEVTKKTRELVNLWKPGGRFILNAGCAIPATTPPENIHAMIQVTKEVGRYD